MKAISRTFAVGMLAGAVALAVQAAGGTSPTLRDGRDAARIDRAAPGKSLTAPGSATASTVVLNWLRGKGRQVQGLRVKADNVDRDGVRQLRMKQEIGGLEVYGAYVKAAVGKRGELISVIDNLAPVPATGLKAATINEAAALRIAFSQLKINAAAPAARGRSGAETQFAKSREFVDAPRVTRVAVPLSDGSLQVGFKVETWQAKGNRLVETLVSGDGRVLDVVERTSRDSYRVFTVDPETTPQAIVPGEAGWLHPGSHRTIDIAGNNVHAYLDAENDSVPDAGGTTVTNGNFLAVFDPAVQPSTPTNREVAVQNLFYLNNVIHDRLYAAGFDELAGNFQEFNFGLGGFQSDSVNAEAQDGGGTDNANFATPNDGRNPRMQMYLWSSPEPDHQVIVGGTVNATYGARRAEFSPPFDTPLEGEAVLANDGTDTTSDGCESIPNVSGKVAVIDRGTCTFVIKAQNALAGGAIGMIVVNSAAGGDDPIVMGGTEPQIKSVMIGFTDGTTLKANSGVAVTIQAIDPPLIRRDGDLDSDIVWHEYGHGLTWRMIDHMSGTLAGAIGEGMADVLAIIVNDNDRVAEYSTGNELGLRSQPYANYTRTYGDIVGEQVHFDGEVYGAIGWRLWQNFEAAGRDADDVLAILVNGMNYTPQQPRYEDMRDGILAPLTDVADRCRVWEAFAHYGVGVGARGKDQGKKATVAESFALPAECQPTP